MSRDRILEAAARVYAKHGFKGATTRAIAIEADVNEVTLFRTFGSKSALLEAVLMRQVEDQPECGLPDDPTDPHRELRDFIQGSLDCIAELRPLLIHTMGEVEERAEAREFACRGRQQSHDTISTYLRHLQEKGMADPAVDANAAAVMLVGTIISDVMGRPIIPDIYPPLDRVADEYARLFLRAIGAGAMIATPEETPASPTPSIRATARPSASTSHTPESSPS